MWFWAPVRMGPIVNQKMRKPARWTLVPSVTADHPTSQGIASQPNRIAEPSVSAAMAAIVNLKMSLPARWTRAPRSATRLMTPSPCAIVPSRMRNAGVMRTAAMDGADPSRMAVRRVFPGK